MTGSALVFLSESTAARRLAAAWPSLGLVELPKAATEGETFVAVVEAWAEAANVSRREARRWGPVLTRTGICVAGGLDPQAERFLFGLSMVDVLGRARPVLPKRPGDAEPGKAYKV